MPILPAKRDCTLAGICAECLRYSMPIVYKSDTVAAHRRGKTCATPEGPCRCTFLRFWIEATLALSFWLCCAIVLVGCFAERATRAVAEALERAGATRHSVACQNGKIKRPTPQLHVVRYISFTDCQKEQRFIRKLTILT